MRLAWWCDLASAGAAHRTERKFAYLTGARTGAAARADANDVLNMRLIAPSAKFADLTVESL